MDVDHKEATESKSMEHKPSVKGFFSRTATYTVRYDQVNALLLNGFLRAHRKVEEQGSDDRMSASLSGY